MNTPEEMLETLARSEMFKKYERAYTDATGLPLTLRPVETWRLPLHGKRRENAFCALLAGNGPTCSACLRSQEGTGRVGVDIDLPTTRKAYFKTPVVSERKLESLSDLLAIFADHLSLASNQIALQKANAEPPMIARARQYIREHHTEALTLGGVAAAMHNSVFYFCKLFHKSTGTTFTEFVSRVRVERARDLLLNPNLRVSEIVFEVEFQSLTHFNRRLQDRHGDVTLRVSTEVSRRLRNAGASGRTA